MGTDVVVYLALASVGTVFFVLRLLVALFFGGDSDFDTGATTIDASPEKMATSALTISTLIALMGYMLFAFSTASSIVPTI